MPVMRRPQTKQELFNLRHSQARNIVERTFGVFKRRYRIFDTGPEYPIETQAALIQALCVLHNVIRVYDPMDVPEWLEEDDEVAEKDNEGTSDTASQSRRINNHAEKAAADNLREMIADQMWRSYQEELRLRRLRQKK